MREIFLAIGLAVATTIALLLLWVHRFEHFPNFFCDQPVATRLDDVQRKLVRDSPVPFACEAWYSSLHGGDPLPAALSTPAPK